MPTDTTTRRSEILARLTHLEMAMREGWMWREGEDHPKEAHILRAELAALDASQESSHAL